MSRGSIEWWLERYFEGGWLKYAAVALVFFILGALAKG